MRTARMRTVATEDSKSGEGSGTRTTSGSLEHDDLVRKYGEAMLWVSALEDQVRSLDKLLEESTGGPQLTELARKFEALERWLGGSSGEATEQGAAANDPMESPEERPAPRERDTEVERLRLRVSGLATELVQTQERLAEVKKRRVRRRPGSHHRPKWQFWRRRRNGSTTQSSLLLGTNEDPGPMTGVFFCHRDRPWPGLTRGRAGSAFPPFLSRALSASRRGASHGLWPRRPSPCTPSGLRSGSACRR